MEYEKKLIEKIIRGDTWDGYEFTLTRAGIDYAGATIRATFKNKIDGKVFFTKTITPTATGSGTITFTFSLTAAETADLKDVVYTDIEITTSVDVRTPISFMFTVINDITV